MNIKKMPQDERPVEKSRMNGVGSLSNAELVAIILGSGSRDKSAISLAEEIISGDDGIRYLTESSFEELLDYDGIGPMKAAKIMAAVELGKRISAKPAEERIAVGDSLTIAKLFMEQLRYEKKEYFKEVLLNTKLEIISIETVSVGALSQTVVHPREVFKQAVKRSASGIVFVHNHPSGDPTPSREDMETTKQLCRAGEILGVRVLDHIIIGDGIFKSLREMNIID